MPYPPHLSNSSSGGIQTVPCAETRHGLLGKPGSWPQRRRSPGLFFPFPEGGSVGMSTVRIPPVLRSQTGGAKEIQADGQTVGEVLGHLAEQYPSLRDRLFQDGQLHRFVNVFVNDQDIQYLEKLDT